MAEPVRYRALKFIRQTTVEPVIFLYMLNMFLLMPTFQALVYRKVCIFKYNDTSICEHLENLTYKSEEVYVQKTSSLWILYSNLAFGLPSIVIVTFFLGPWGDTVGRKLPVVLPVIGSILNSVFNLLNAIFISWPMAMLLIGNLLNGITGGFIAAMMGVYSYVGHNASEEFKTIRVGIVESLIFLAGTFGVLLSGILLDRTSFTFVFSLTTGITCLALIYTLIFLPDIKPEKNKTSSRFMKLCYERHLRESWLCLVRKRPNRTTLFISMQLLVMVIMIFCTAGEFDLLYLFTKLPAFDWPMSTYGYYKALESFLRGLAVLTLLPVLKWKVHLKDTTLAISGLVSKIFAFIVLGIASMTWHIFLVAVIGILQGFTSAALRSTMSSMVEKNEQGKLFGLVATLESIGVLLATVVFNNLYPATLTFFSGFCFILAAGLLFLALLIVIMLHYCLNKLEDPSYTLMNDNEYLIQEDINQNDNDQEDIQQDNDVHIN